MSVTASYEPAVADCDGSVTEFSFSFPIFDSGDITVTHTDAAGTETELTLNTDYTVSAQNNDYANGGSIVTTATYASGETITIERTVDLTQPNDFSGNELNTTTLENTLDRLLMLIQQVNDKYARVLQQPTVDGTGNLELPNATARASKTFIFDASGDPAAGSATTATVSAFMETVVDDADAATAQATLGVPSDAEMAIAESQNFVDSQTVDAGASVGSPVFKNGTKETVDTCDIADWTDDAEMTSAANSSEMMDEGGALNLTKDTGAAALASIAKTVLNQIDFTSKDLYFFLYVKDATALNKLIATDAVTIRYGSDASNYYQWTVDKSALTAEEWNLLGPFDTDNEDSTTGSPTIAAMDYAYIGLTATNAAIVWSAGDFIMDYWFVLSDEEWQLATDDTPTPQGINVGSNKIVLKGYTDELQELIPYQWYWMKDDGSLTTVPGEAYNATRLFYAISDTEAFVDIAVEGNNVTTTDRQGRGGTVKGFQLGGYRATYTAVIADLSFSTETSNEIVDTLGTATSVSGGVCSSSDGYACGGEIAGYTGKIEKLQFSGETVSLMGVTLDDTRGSPTGIMSETTAYLLAGYDGAYKDVIDDLVFAAGTSTELAETLDYTTSSSPGVMSTSKGYLMGGYDNRTAIHDFVFATEVGEEITATLQGDGRETGAGVYSPTRGYACGGSHGATVYDDDIDRLTFSTEACTKISAVLTDARNGVSGVSSISKGYLFGGSDGTNKDIIEALVFSTEVLSDTGNDLDNTVRNANGVQY